MVWIPTRQQAGSDLSWPGPKSAYVLAASAPACEGDFTLTSYLQSDVQIAYSALSSARQEGGALYTEGEEQLSPSPGAPRFQEGPVPSLQGPTGVCLSFLPRLVASHASKSS